jgi:hypothetical protein
MKAKLFGEPWDIIFTSRDEGEEGFGYSIPEMREIYIYDDVEEADTVEAVLAIKRQIYLDSENEPEDEWEDFDV